MCLNEILNVNMQNNEQLEIYLKYTSNLITSKVIKIEILLFLNIVKISYILFLINILNLN